MMSLVFLNWKLKELRLKEKAKNIDFLREHRGPWRWGQWVCFFNLTGTSFNSYYLEEVYGSVPQPFLHYWPSKEPFQHLCLIIPQVSLKSHLISITAQDILLSSLISFSVFEPWIAVEIKQSNIIRYLVSICHRSKFQEGGSLVFNSMKSCIMFEWDYF